MDSIEMQHKENQIHYRNLTDMFRQLKELLEILKDYLLSPDNLWLDSMGIYMDRNSGEYMFTYIPGLERDFRKQFESFVSWIMKVIDHNEKIQSFLYIVCIKEFLKKTILYLYWKM